MNDQINHPRRAFLASAVGATGSLGVLASAGCGGPGTNDRQLQWTSLAQAEEEVARLAKAAALDTAAAWNFPQTLVHCAQSIEYSMTGFPQPKSALFQRTLGSAAFAVFGWRGRMTHDLADPIPGAPALDATLAAPQALERLGNAIRDYRQWQKPLQPHFAYGALDKKEFELAHAMHIAQHLSGFQVRA